VRIGLSGGIGSGKSEVARRLATLGAIVVDADAIAREVVEPGTPGLAAVTAEFGSDVLAADGSLDRAALAAVVFSDSSRLAALEAITHPLIAARSAELLSAAAGDGVVVYDVPLLVEKDLGSAYDVIVIVDAPDDVRLDRMAQRGITREDVRRRMAVQASRQQRLAVADHVIDNSGGLTALWSQVDLLWAELSATAL
jgi:dephospho-CoA kinase